MKSLTEREPFSIFDTVKVLDEPWTPDGNYRMAFTSRNHGNRLLTNADGYCFTDMGGRADAWWKTTYVTAWFPDLSQEERARAYGLLQSELLVEPIIGCMPCGGASPGVIAGGSGDCLVLQYRFVRRQIVPARQSFQVLLVGRAPVMDLLASVRGIVRVWMTGVFHREVFLSGR